MFKIIYNFFLILYIILFLFLFVIEVYKVNYLVVCNQGYNSKKKGSVSINETKGICVTI